MITRLGKVTFRRPKNIPRHAKKLKDFTYWIDIDSNIYNRFGKVMKHSAMSNGRPQIVLCKNGKHYTKRVYRLLALAFLPRIKGKDYVNHKDGDFKNGKLDNLEWCTPSENKRHATRIGIFEDRGAYNGSAKLTKEDVLKIRALKDSDKLSNKTIAAMFGVASGTIWEIVTRRTHTIY